MNAKEALHWMENDTGIMSCNDDAWPVVLRALRLLAAAEANDGNCPETEAAMCRYTGGEPVTFPKGLSAVVPYSFAANLERERNGLAARVVELEAALDRYGCHADSCGDMDAMNGAEIKSCNCGLDAARSK